MIILKNCFSLSDLLCRFACLTTTQHSEIMNIPKRNYIFDFDSTLTRVEALDVLAEITLANNPKKNEIIQEDHRRDYRVDAIICFICNFLQFRN